MIRLALAMITMVALVGCDSQAAAGTAWNSFKTGCDRRSFVVELKSSGTSKTFTATCEVTR